MTHPRRPAENRYGQTDGPGQLSYAMQSRAQKSSTPGEIELIALTPEYRAAIEREKMTVRTLVIVAVVAAAPVEIGLAITHQSSRNHLLWGAGVFLFVACLFAGIVLWQRWKTSRDLREGTFTRYTGPLRVSERTTVDNNGVSQTHYYVHLGDIKRLSIESADAKAISAAGVSAGQLDIATHTHELLELRNMDGNVVARGWGLRKVLDGGAQRTAPAAAPADEPSVELG